MRSACWIGGLRCLKVETDDGTSFVLRDDLDKLKQQHTIVSQDILVPRGSLGSFTGREGREYGFVKLLASNRDDLARGLALPPDAVLEDQSLVGNWRPVIIDLDGPITPRRVRQVKTLIGSEIKDHHVNWIGVRIDSTGGEVGRLLAACRGARRAGRQRGADRGVRAGGGEWRCGNCRASVRSVGDAAVGACWRQGNARAGSWHDR